MKDGNPQGIKITPKPTLAGISKRPLVIALSLIGIIILTYLVIMGSRDQKKEEAPAQLVVTRSIDTNNAMTRSTSTGIIDDKPEGVIEPAKTTTVQEKQGQPQLIQVIMPEQPQNRPLYDEDELRMIRAIHVEQFRNAIYSPLKTEAQVRLEDVQGAYTENTVQSGSSSGNPRINVADMTAHLRVDSGNSPDETEIPPEIQAQLGGTGSNTFTSNADDNWQLGYSRRAGMTFELKTGTVIPGVLITGINSDLSGSVSAQVSQNVYDSTTGKYLLVPQGTKLYGDYANGVAFGQDRLFISWKRILFPDGSSLTIGDMGGSDQAGQSGFADQVNNHYFRIFGSAILMSGITAGVSYATNKSGTNNNSNEPTMQNELNVALAQQLGQVGMAIIQKHINVSPTISIRPGYKFSIVCTKDLVFQASYKPMATK